MRVIQPVMASLMVGGMHCFCNLWTITRQDGVVFRFTNHDAEIIRDGETYSPAGSALTASAQQDAEGLQPGNLDAQGAITADSITDADLEAGLFRLARVEEVQIDWRFPWAGKFVRSVYLIEETTADGALWKAKIAGLMLKLKNTVGGVYSKTCRHRLGDEMCDPDGTVMVGRTETGRTVSALSEDRRIFTSDATGADARFSFGYITWTTGANAGFESEIKEHLSAGGSLELQIETPYDIAPGDTFTVQEGCDKLFPTCDGRFGNHKHFGGYRDVPGNDKLFRTPNAR